MSRTPSPVLSPEQEAEAQSLAQRIRELSEEEFLLIARLLVSKSEPDLFGDAEFQVRDILLRAGAKAFEEHLRQKKRLPGMRCSLSALPANSRLSGIPTQVPGEPLGRVDGAAGLLLLPSLRARSVPLGRERSQTRRAAHQFTRAEIERRVR